MPMIDTGGPMDATAKEPTALATLTNQLNETLYAIRESNDTLEHSLTRLLGESVKLSEKSEVDTPPADGEIDHLRSVANFLQEEMLRTSSISRRVNSI